MKTSIIFLSALVAIAYSYPASDGTLPFKYTVPHPEKTFFLIKIAFLFTVKLDGHEISHSQIQLNDPKPSVNKDKTPKPNAGDTFSKMSNCGQLLTAKVVESDIVTVATEENVNKNE
ncbi:hypothetical protein TWF506_001519 [Arthrobotrys conoides]|uniref:Uncharacterized protein n=1 Tax=Arthrobotrys conoides TaxID=74498 RepID=A0AAN8S599_9PEZI